MIHMEKGGKHRIAKDYQEYTQLLKRGWQPLTRSVPLFTIADAETTLKTKNKS